ncbi:MAG: hypothetical protein JW702_09530 [Clostridiales bacterium]|nr:hypothetical protein [Clostridiales bacterium]
MDWKKTKNILIIALLIMNVFLVYNIYFKDNIDQEIVDLTAVKKLLRERDIDISSISQQTYKEMPKFSVSKIEYKQSELTEIEELGFDLTTNEDVLSANFNLVVNSDVQLQELIENVKVILGIDAENSVLIYNYHIDGKTFALYNQDEDGYIFDDGYLKIESVPDQYVLIEYQWLDISKNDESLNGLIYPIEKSILSLLDLNKNDGETIRIIDYQIVYRVEEKEDLVIDSITTSEPLPYWRAITDKNESVYFNGLR